MLKCYIPPRERRGKLSEQGARRPARSQASNPSPLARGYLFFFFVVVAGETPSKCGRPRAEIPLRIGGRRGGIKKSDGSIWRGRKEAEGKRVAPARDPAPRFAKSELCRRDCELMDVSRMDIFCSVAIYGWRGLEGGGG